MLMTFSYMGELLGWNWARGTGLSSWAGMWWWSCWWWTWAGRGAAKGNLEFQTLFLKHTVHARRAGMGTAPWDTAFPDGWGTKVWPQDQQGWGMCVRSLCGAQGRGCSRAQRVVTLLKLWEFTKYCSEKLEQEACDFLCIIRAAAALKLGLGSLLPRAEIQSRRSTRASCSFSQICQCFCAVLWGKSKPWTSRPKKN